MYLLQEKSFTISRDVVFKEDVFPFQHLSTTFPLIFSPPLCSTQYCLADSIYVPHDHDPSPRVVVVNPSPHEILEFPSKSEVAPLPVPPSVEPVRKSYKTPKPPI